MATKTTKERAKEIADKYVDVEIVGQIGDNNPPDAIDEITAQYADYIEEAQNWTDGTPVENEDQAKAVDALIKAIKSALKDLALAEKSATTPLHDKWKAEIARFRPTKDDLTMMRNALVATGAAFKAKLAKEKEEIKRLAYLEARKVEEAAQKKIDEAAADSGNLEAQRIAEDAKRKITEAKKVAAAANKDKVTGLRTVHKYEIDDMAKLVNWIAKNDKAAMADFAREYARVNHKDGLDGVRSWTIKEAY